MEFYIFFNYFFIDWKSEPIAALKYFLADVGLCHFVAEHIFSLVLRPTFFMLGSFSLSN